MDRVHRPRIAALVVCTLIVVSPPVDGASGSREPDRRSGGEPLAIEAAPDLNVTADATAARASDRPTTMTTTTTTLAEVHDSSGTTAVDPPARGEADQFSLATHTLEGAPANTATWRLRADAGAGCVWLENPENGRTWAVRWPEGTDARQDGNGVELVLDGVVVGRADGLVAIGGFYPTVGRLPACHVGEDEVLVVSVVGAAPR